MTYFIKPQVSNWSFIIPSIVLPLVFKDAIEANFVSSHDRSWIDTEGNNYNQEVNFMLYLATWRLSSLLIADLIEEKLSYEKEDLKLTDRLFVDLGADSLDLVEMALYLEKTAGLPIHENLKFERVSDLIDYVFSIMVRRIQKSTLVWPKTELNILADW